MHMTDFANISNSGYLDQLYQQYQANPNALPEPWRAFFAGFELAGPRLTAAIEPVRDEQLLHLGLHDLVHSYRELGHFEADLDPLGQRHPPHPLLELREFNMTEADLDRPIGAGNFLGQTDGTLRDLLARLRDTYCRTIGVEYMFISDKDQRDWLAQHMEPVYNRPAFSADETRWILSQLTAAQGFEEYIHTKYVGSKRFSLEGAESFIPLVNTLLEEGGSLGVEQFVMGMAHRGRLNALAHVLHKPYEVIFSEFEGYIPQTHEGDGDVKYHLGYSHNRITRTGQRIHVGLSFNPSHLELINPVVEGMVRAKQTRLHDEQRTRVVPILVHGDASFTGQGIVLETLALSEMPFWRTGGTIHVLINNQIGFTTSPKQGRFTPYPTDVAKTIQAPIFHVNGDDPEACVWAAKLAIAFRQKFHSDVFIDLWCYRRHGHNEVDEPSFTQPVLYRQIEQHPPVRDLYARKLETEGKLVPADVAEMKQQLQQRLDRALAVAKEARPRQADVPFGGMWRGLTRAGADWSAQTAVSPDVLRKIAENATRLPEGFTLHPKLKRLVQARHDMGLGQSPIDWGGAEMFALGSLALEGTAVRLTGQDVQRGTFSHRHAAYVDYNTGKKYFPLSHLDQNQAPVIVVNTMLSELAVLGFEYGFASADPYNLIMWEAQFGDFVNGAQAIIDQFIAGAESKWQKFCGLVMLLPHGYEGQGPEHSYGYLDRFLALCAENNMQVCQPSLPAQYFHVLRRQMRRTFRKPLILMMPKSLLRSEAATSKLEDLTTGTYQLVIDDPTITTPQRIRRVLFCSGKIYYTLHAAREKHNLHELAIVRIEQLYPYPQKEIQAILARYNRAEEIAWVQDEPKNRGAWSFMEPRLREILPDGRVLNYYGRDEAASPATGSYRLHQLEEQEILSRALEMPTKAAQQSVPVATPREAAEKAAPVSD